MTRYRDDLVWLSPSLVAGCIAYVFYLATNPYPAHGAGLFFTMAEQVSRHGYALPETIPFYSGGGVPFAYPPLAIYAIALFRDLTGVGALAASRWIPGLVVIASLVPTYVLARDLLSSRASGALVAALVAANPQLLDWHLTAGGLVRAPAFLFATVGLLAGLRRVRTGSRRWLGLGVACFAATLLTHPTTALFFAVSYLALFAILDRSPAGLVDGALVGVGGLVLAAPWWLAVVRTHGIDVFIGAMGTHGGVGGGVLADLATVSPGPVVVLLVLVGALSVIAGLATGSYFLVGWLVAVGVSVSQPRFTLYVGTFLLVAVVHEVGGRSRCHRRALVRRRGPAILVAVAVVIALLVSAGYIRDDTAAPRPSVTPDQIDGADLEAMAWARRSTPPDASFVVLGDTAEWFPFFAERTLLVSPWGTEWEEPGTYERHTTIYRTVSGCDTEGCLSAALSRHDVRPDYVYVPKESHHVQGTPHRRSAGLSEQLERSDRYVQAFENEDVAIYRVVPPARRASGTGPRSAAAGGRIDGGTRPKTTAHGQGDPYRIVSGSHGIPAR